MGSYFLKRFMLFLISLCGIVCFNILLMQSLPGGPIDHLLSTHWSTESDSGTLPLDTFKIRTNDTELIEAMREHYGFNLPLSRRFFVEIKKLLRFDFGESYFHHMSVRELILDKMPVSLSLGIILFFVSYVLSIPLGLYRARRQGSKYELLLGICTVFLNSIPSFVLAVLLMTFFGGGSFFDLFPIRGLSSFNVQQLNFIEKVGDYCRHLFLPALSLSAGTLAFMSLLTKNAVLEELKQDYVKALRSMGIPETLILYKHVLRNSAVPLVTGGGRQLLGIFFTSSLLIESLFSLDGVGLLFYESLLHRDYPVVTALILLIGISTSLGNFLGDLVYMYLDPRISLSRN